MSATADICTQNTWGEKPHTNAVLGFSSRGVGATHHKTAGPVDITDRNRQNGNSSDIGK